MLQRGRTPRAASILASSTDQMLLHAYLEYLKTQPESPARTEAIDAIQAGHAILKDSNFAGLMTSLTTATRSVPAISDLSLLILRNHTEYPFILGDSPCVLSNHYMRQIRDWGVLGFLQAGLMAIMPINNSTLAMYYDGAVYTPYSSSGFIDIHRKSDVSQLNALQIHSAQENVYFSDLGSEQYVRDLIAAHRPILQHSNGRFAVRRPGECLVDGHPSVRELLHTYEAQLPITPELSFIITRTMPQNQNPNLPRSEELEQKLAKAVRLTQDASPFPIGSLANWIEGNICIRGKEASRWSDETINS